MKRRDLLLSAPAVLAVSGLRVEAAPEPSPEPSKADLIRHHAEALLSLIREDFPEDLSTLSVQVFSNWGPIEHQRVRSTVTATGGRVVRVEDEQTGKVRWVAYDGGHWSQSNQHRGLDSTRVVATGNLRAPL